MNAPPSRVLVIGLGNPDRGDDAAGILVADRLVGKVPPGVTVHSRSGDMLSLIEAWAGFDVLICVDAAAPMGSPGRIHRIGLDGGALPLKAVSPSSHAFGLAEAIELARVLELAPPEIVVHAIEGKRFDSGAAPTGAVLGAAETVAARIVSELRQSDTHAGEVAADA